MVGIVVLLMLVGWLACALFMSVYAGLAARRAHATAERIRCQAMQARGERATIGESAAISHS